MTDISLTFGPYDYSSPIGGDQPLKTRLVTIAQNATVIAPYSVLGHVTGSDSYALAASAATDGSANPSAVSTSMPIDATAGPVQAWVYFEGEFADRLLVYGVGHTAVTVETAFRDANSQLYIRQLPIFG